MENSMAVFQKITNKLLYYPIIPLLGIYPKELKAGTLTFIVALFAIAKRWKQPKYSLTDEWINNVVSQSASSVAQSCPTLCDPMDCSTPGFPVHHQLPKLAQTHVHWVDDAIQPSHALSSPSPPAFNLLSFPVSQFFTSGGQSIGPSASVLSVNIQDWFPIGWAGWISLQSKGLSRVFNTTVQKHQFFTAQFSL